MPEQHPAENKPRETVAVKMHDASETPNVTSTLLEALGREGEIAPVRQTQKCVVNPAAPGSTPVFRPLNRPPMAILTALDDGSLEDGQSWRIRDERFSIGRLEGDALVPHDQDISSRHAEITRIDNDGAYEWYLTDLNSTNGTFVRVDRIVLRHAREMIVGLRRFAFRHPNVLPGAIPDSPAPQASPRAASPRAASPRAASPRAASPRATNPRATNPIQHETGAVDEQLAPRLVLLGVDGEMDEFPLKNGTRIGRDASMCPIAFPDDPFLDPSHVRFRLDKANRWIAEDLKSVNGLWIRTTRLQLHGPTEFMAGGQRFRFSPQ